MDRAARVGCPMMIAGVVMLCGGRPTSSRRITSIALPKSPMSLTCDDEDNSSGSLTIMTATRCRSTIMSPVIAPRLLESSDFAEDMLGYTTWIFETKRFKCGLSGRKISNLFGLFTGT
jgi:hypothetical protein